MPIHWTVSHATRSVVITATGVIRLADMQECVRAIAMPATLSYRKLVDFGEAELAFGRDGVMALSRYIREHRGIGRMGALAIVVGSDAVEQQARQFRSLEVEDRPLKIFRDAEAARAWLDTQPSPLLPAWLELADEPLLPTFLEERP
jgi:stage II sporulation SpoAA-like protein